MKTIKLRFIRPPNNVKLWKHEFVYQDEEVIISKFKFEELTEPFKVMGDEVIENGYTGICYEFRHRGLEVIKVLDFKNRLMGYYCNINMPPKFFDGGYEVTDLFIDVWVFPHLEYVVLDKEEFERAVENGWVTGEDEKFALSVLKTLIEDINNKMFPPSMVRQYG